MDSGCSICLCKYTLNEHYAVSLLCGHVFGNSCIMNWFQKKRTANCPTCFKKCKKNEIRKIFSSNIASISSSEIQWLIERHNKQKNYLKKLVAYTELLYCYKKNRQPIRSIDLPHLQMEKHVEWNGSVDLFLFDEIAGAILFVDSNKDKEVRKYSVDRGTSTLLCKYTSRVTSLVGVPGCNTYVAVTSEYLVQIIDYMNGNVICYSIFGVAIAKCIFHRANELLLIFINGEAMLYNISLKKSTGFLIPFRILSMACGNNLVFASPNGVYRYEKGEEYRLMKDCIAINVAAEGENIACLLRDDGNQLSIKMIGSINQTVDLSISCRRKKWFFLLNNFIVVNQNNFIHLYCFDGTKVRTIDVRYPITSMHVNKNRLAIFTERSFLIYK